MADAVVILGEDRTDVAGLIERGRRRCRPTALPVFNARIVPAMTDALRGRAFLAFCGIGRPAKFFDTLQEAGIAVVKSRSFPDHHPFDEADARSLLAEAKALHAGLITTEKDHARLGSADGALGELCRSTLALPVSVEFADGGEAQLSRLISPLVMPEATCG
jgi:tetraacyldisaccharide 4'-kinase